VIGFLVCVAGVSVGLWSVITLRKQYCEELVRYEGCRLVTSGIYGVVRHPARIGMFLEACGMALIVANGFALFALCSIVVVQVLRTNEEDRMLRDFFGAEAEEYVKAVPGFNIFKWAWQWTLSRN
jgi:protein-S-isoprenylcysteine O-methyltransferase Ste14